MGSLKHIALGLEELILVVIGLNVGILVGLGKLLGEVGELVGGGHLVVSLVDPCCWLGVPLGSGLSLFNDFFAFFAVFGGGLDLWLRRGSGQSVAVGVDATSYIDEFVSGLVGTLIVTAFLGCSSLGIFHALRELNFLDVSVVKRLVGLFILESEPGLVMGALFDEFFPCVEASDGQEEAGFLVLEVREAEAHLPVIVDFELVVTEVPSEA